ncbi:Unknown protein sequence [Pseudomonas syringae pv. maculicola]|nr:Unknown protein sequence [Pseudomonas syringae pv. maculicola]
MVRVQAIPEGSLRLAHRVPSGSLLPLHLTPKPPVRKNRQ